MTAIKQNSTRSELWQLPVVSDSRDDEFIGDTLSSFWIPYNGTTALPATVSANTVNTYDTTFSSTSVIRATVQDSWVNLQTPANSNFFSMSKAISVGTNVLVYARVKVNIKTTGLHSVNDYATGIGLYQDIGGIADLNNGVFIYVNSSAVNVIQSRAQKTIAGVLTIGPTSDNLGRSGSPIEYVAIHKVGTTYHHWVGTDASWVYMGSITAAITPAYIGFTVVNSTTTAPGVGVVGIDFIRFIDTANFLL